MRLRPNNLDWIAFDINWTLLIPYSPRGTRQGGATEEPPLVANQAEEEEEEEDPEEYPPPYSPLPPFHAYPKLGPGEYNDPHNWNYDGDLDQWGTDVVEGEPAAAHDWDSPEEEEEDRSTSSDSTN
ncbi:hypothetical protein PIB30_039183 [Stylosanthes scabra]|uniref:Uncharacterized protein n=1 Tax=Stylosanthes scabra TaxID=79078 RepID=A0ABU6XEE5_9FABA|nr:hypothetical protein [Stylosanthes scabra]